VRALTLFALLAACGSPTKPPSPPARVATPPPSTSTTDPLALIPAASDIVFKFDGAAARKSTLWTKYERYVLDFIAPALVECGYNPLRDLTSVTVGIPMGDELGLFVFRGIDREKTLGCLRSSTRETNTTATFDGEYVKLLNKSGKLNLLTFVDASTMVIQGSDGPTKETLRRALQITAARRSRVRGGGAERRAGRGDLDDFASWLEGDRGHVDVEARRAGTTHGHDAARHGQSFGPRRDRDAKRRRRRGVRGACASAPH
jgi:hypothetical protein